MNWLDWVIVVLLVGGVINGFREGFVRLTIGFGALIVGFFAASWFHGIVAGHLMQWVSNRTMAVMLAYALIFFGVIALGALVAALIVRFFKLIGLSPVDRVLGAAFGAVRATAGLVVVVMLVMAFAPNRLPAAVNDSTLAPYIVGASRVFAAVTPFEIRHGVEKKYEELRGQIDKLKTLKKLPSREE